MRLSVIGLGKLGAPLAAALAAAGHEVVGADLNERAVRAVNDGVAPVFEPGLQELIDASEGRLTAVTDTRAAVHGTEVTFVIVPTPSDPDGTFSLRFILPAIEAIGTALRADETQAWHTTVVTSTVMPGATASTIVPALEAASGRTIGVDAGVCYSPEFIALGSVVRDLLNPDMILIGQSDDRAGSDLEKILTELCNGNPPVRRMGLVNAEISKIAVNTYVTTKISYANMLADLCNRLPGADVDVVTTAVGSDSRIGHKYLQGATAYGGPCFPRDNRAFATAARQVGATAALAEATDEVNRNQLDRLHQLTSGLVSPGGRVTVLGLSYKPGTPVSEESAGVALACSLRDVGIAVTAHDPMAADGARATLTEAVTIADDLPSALEGADVVVVTTPWPEFAGLADTLAEDRRSVRTLIDCWRMYDAQAIPGVDIVHPGTARTSHNRPEGTDS